ncbi:MULTISPECIES: thioredoxin fold domain-containing protein [Thiorhodovibrio]|uniref:thioredoxin fold domain-containing protein n=1 Tax=Thiorhodovibrio TaxID=61593 RepID=UPI0019140B69|nr:MULTISPECIES: thioredoxin fold domain-containing protein [Thiorhodovibrio]MBK5968846.1 disulfide bond formation protein DsbC [Thiorhodovibrio winogradskyi]WPL12616.1 Thiol:disulfide interchange protein DsbC precursor [Thiorhodovibrio litoralis]
MITLNKPHNRAARSLTMAAAVALGMVLTGGAALADEAANIRAALAKVLPDHKPTSVKPSVVDGLYQVDIGPQVMFVTADGRYLIDGAIVDLESRENIADAAQADARQRTMAGVKDDESIVFAADDPKHTITVFTDIDCGYCRKLHHQIDGYNKEGISVRYLFFPRSGVGSPSYDKAVSVWCAKDQKSAMTAAKNGESVENATCENPVKDQMELGELLGIRGTPAIVLENGDLVPGYVEPKRLAKMLDDSAENAAAN